MCPSDNSDGDSLSKTVGIVATYVSNNSLPASELPDLIASVHASLCRLSQAPVTAPAPAPSAPAVPIKKSVTREYVVCLEDGKRFKSLRRHLSSFHDMTPEQYRAKWDLASDYPMVAPAYSETRSRLAKDSGLGLAGKETEVSAPATPPGAPAGPPAAPASAPARKPGRGRPKKSS